MNATHEEHQLNNNDHLSEVRMVLSENSTKNTWRMTVYGGVGVYPSQEVQLRTDQVYNMAAVMYRAALVEDASVQLTTEKISRLEYENRHLRELLQFSMPVVYPNDRTKQQPGSDTANIPSQQAGVSRATAVPSPAPQSATPGTRILNSNSVDQDSRSSTPQAMEEEQGTLDRQTFTEDR